MTQRVRNVSRDELRHCFACGVENDYGLHLEFEWGNGSSRASFVPDRRHQGWDGVVHGGILTTVLDEALAYAAIPDIGPTVTGRLEVRFHTPATVDEPLLVEGRCGRRYGKGIEASAQIRRQDGSLVAEASGILLLMRGADAPAVAEETT
jgi:acyl-coenzyme A thioesterase PaaI-like protein